MSKGAIRIGTSGWHYAHWRGCFYPPGLPASDWLSAYARHFHCVEVNNSFYRLPAVSTIATWFERTPPDFVFAIKASRLITHLKKLGDSEDSLERLLRVSAGFGPKLGPILFQLPPRWHLNLERLQRFLSRLPAGPRYSFEFRDPSWHCAEVYEELAQANAAFCAFDLAGFQSPRPLTADFAYIRLHGPAIAYCGSYSEATLREWRDRLREWSAQGRDVYLFFDNDEAGYAVENALRLSRMAADGFQV